MTSRIGNGLAVATVAAAVLLLRSWFFMVWEEAYFDSDQAIVGLMAKHLAEGRARPLFFYGQEYMLAVEAWLMAPVVWLLGASVLSLRLTMVLINFAAAMLLWHLLVSEAQLDRWAAALAASPFWLAPFVTSAHLIEAQGGNVEQFVWVLVIWLLRRRSLALGGALAVAFLNREFSIYAAPAILVVQIVEARGRVRGLVRPWAMTVAVFAVTVMAVTALKPFADPLGPGSAGAALPGPASNNVSLLVAQVNLDLAALPARVTALAGGHVPLLFGLQTVSPELFSIWTTAQVGWPELLPIVGLASVVSLVLLARDLIRRPWPMSAGAFPAFLVIVALESAVGYVVSRTPGIYTIRFGLLMLLLPVGVGALLLQRWRSRAVRLGGVVVLGLLAAGSAVDHAWVNASARTSPPPVRLRRVADRLVERGERVALADYWRAYAITFLSGERVKVATTTLIERVREYQVLAAQSAPPVVRVSPAPCAAGESAEAVGQWFLCK